MADVPKLEINPFATKLRRSRILNMVLAALLVFLGIVLFAQMTTGGQTAGPGAVQTPAPTAAPGATASETPGATAGKLTHIENPAARNDPNDALAIGSMDAPIVLVQWTDPRCPFCAVFARDTLPQIIEEYVDSGKVRIEFHDVAFFGEQSEAAAVAARAAGRQGLGVEYFDALFAAAPESGHADLPAETLIAFAEKVGVPDMAAFTADLTDPVLIAESQAATADAHSLGVGSVPFFFTGDKSLSGAQPMEVFREYLDAALATTAAPATAK